MKSNLIKNISPTLIGTVLVIIEILLSAIIIKKISYTEIDWIAYMQEVQGYLDGERNYMNLKGDTGPLVYPAGFLYIFSGLHWITNSGVDILTGQIIFAFIYIINLIVILRIYFKGSKIPMLVCVSLIVSKRIHSIFMLRMFNDCIAVFFGYLAILLFISCNYRLGSIFYSIGVSVKMNMLLQAPGILLVLLMANGIYETFICLSIMAGLQIILALPFITTFPIEYLSRSFELSRVFAYKWTVNFKFLEEDVFVSKELSLILLGLTIAAFILFASKWINNNIKIMNYFNNYNKDSSEILTFFGPRKLDSHFIITTIFTSNFIGIAFARTLHYQFYCWYFHTLPYLLWGTSLPGVATIMILCFIEYSFNVYPATSESSMLLQICHAVILVAIYKSPTPSAFINEKIDIIRNKNK